MRAPLSWLRDYAPLDADTDRLASTLSELGLVVEGVEHIGAGLGDVVVARVASIRAHPKHDKNRLVSVDAGYDAAVEVICGAWNFSEGDLVPLAPVGAVLPGGFEISRRKMRGEWSNGMLCSARELGLPDADSAADGLLILPPGIAEPGTALVDALGIEPDVVFDIDVSPNRPDALSMAGIARDLAAALGETWSMPQQVGVPVDPTLGHPTVTLQSGDLCPRFTATILEGVPSGPSPDWMARRLSLAGMRPINVVVDVSNYVMLDVGQPNHCYDLGLLGGGGILVRRAEPGERIVTLDGVERALDTEDCVICDLTGSPVGVGAIMGGATAEIDTSTTRVLLEAAWFNPMAVARTGKRLGLHSEARTRFERGVDPEIADAAVGRLLALLAAMPGGDGLRRGPTADARDAKHLPSPPTLTLRTARVNLLLGTELDDEIVAELLRPIGFAVSADAAGVQTVKVPSWRLECSREIDLVEEVARMWGYHRIERSVPTGAGGRSPGLSAFQKQRRVVRRHLASWGFDEAWTTTFLAPGDLERAGLDGIAVEVENPLDRSESILRTSLVPGLLKAARFNIDRQSDELSLYEIGRVFSPPTGSLPVPDEEERLGVIVVPGAGRVSDGAAAEAVVRTWRWIADALRVADWTMETGAPSAWHRGRSCLIKGQQGVLGVVGELDPRVTAAYGIAARVGMMELSLEALLGEPRREMKAREVSRFPASDMDLAFVVDESVQALDLQRCIAGAAGDELEMIRLFDTYRSGSLGEANKSLAFRLRLRSTHRTLTEGKDGDLERIRSAAVDAAHRAYGAQLRA
jgi:phenylalanyl-tRNA synthetase beta chain